MGRFQTQMYVYNVCPFMYALYDLYGLPRIRCQPESTVAQSVGGLGWEEKYRCDVQTPLTYKDLKRLALAHTLC